jgi:hypothetical protein
MQIVEGKLKEPPPEEEVWKWLHEMLCTLGHDGMSSDESDAGDSVDDGYKVKVLSWRRNIDKELEIIDSARKDESSRFAKQGSKPVKRVRGEDCPISTREPVGGLPKAFYDKKWLSQDRHRELRLGVSKEQLAWPRIIVAKETAREEGETSRH